MSDREVWVDVPDSDQIARVMAVHKHAYQMLAVERDHLSDRVMELEAELDRLREQLRLTNIDQLNTEAENERLRALREGQ